MTTLRTSAALLGAVTLAALALTGCGGSSTTTAGVSTPTVTVTETPTSTTATTPPPATPVTSTSSSAPAATCALANLAVTFGTGQGAAGHMVYPLRLRNQGTAPCSLEGYPGVSYVAGSTGTQVGAAAVHTPGPAPAVVLQTGGAVTANVDMTSTGPYDAATCKPVPVRGFRVYPPGSYTAAFVPLPLTACSNPALKTLQVTPIAAR